MIQHTALTVYNHTMSIVYYPLLINTEIRGIYNPTCNTTPQQKGNTIQKGGWGFNNPLLIGRGGVNIYI